MKRNSLLPLSFLVCLLLTYACGNSGNKNPGGVNSVSGIRETNSIFKKHPHTNSAIVSELIEAYRTKNTNKLLELFKTGISPNSTLLSGKTMLMQAVNDNDLKFMRFLLEHGADVNIKDQDGYTAIDYAMEAYPDNAFQLLKKYGAKINYFLENPVDNLCFAAAVGDLNGVKKLISSL